jgi:hypothetical protein
VVVPFTLGIYAIVLAFKRVGRINGFIRRKQRYYEAAVTFTEQHAAKATQLPGARAEVDGIRSEMRGGFLTTLTPITVWLTILLSVVTLGLYSFVVLYRMNRIWNDLQVFEAHFDDRLGRLWFQLGLTKYYALSFNIDPAKKRSYGLYLVLSIVTLGLWGLVWDYKIHNDPNNLYHEFHAVEDVGLPTARAA